MKKTFLTAILTFATTLGFSQEAQPESSLVLNVPSSNIQMVQLQPVAKNTFTYLKIGAADPRAEKSEVIIPGIGLGWRTVAGAGALDLSVSFSGGESNNFLFTLPKVNYLHYLTPASDSSMYLGGGLAYGGMKRFVGLIPNLAIGYEINRHQNWRGFTQLDISQPAIAAGGKVRQGPALELSIGGGF